MSLQVTASISLPGSSGAAYQVALPNDLCCMENYGLIADFCRRFDPQPRTQQVMAKWPNGKAENFRLYCFATREDTEVFADPL